MFLLFTGNGKGKTTSAIGQAVRLLGEGKRVLMIQFIKGPWKSGEDESSKLLHPNFLIIKSGKGFVGILGDKLPREVHRAAARKGLALAMKEAKSGKWDAIILDEVHNAIKLRLLKTKDVLSFVNVALKKLEHLILTGRDAPRVLVSRADLVTEMKEIKHPYAKGKKAQKGIEY